MSRRIHLYRLEIEYPPGSDHYEWCPEDWEQICIDRDMAEHWQGAVNIPEWPGWPTPRIYRTQFGADRRAGYLRRCGAMVTIHRSLPVEWPEVTP